MSNHQPGSAKDINIGIGKMLYKFFCCGQRTFKCIHNVQIIRSSSQDKGRFLMFREGIDKLQRAAHNILLDRILAILCSSGEFLPKRVDCCVAGF